MREQNIIFVANFQKEGFINKDDVKWLNDYVILDKKELNTSKASKIKEVPKIAFLFRIYDNLKNTKIWDAFFSFADPNQYSIFINAR